MSEPREIEAKFEADENTLNRMLSLDRFGDFTLSERDEVLQDDTYYDTAGQHLRQAGATLRIRRRASGARMTFKGERRAAGDSHIVSRLEDEVDLDETAIAGLDDHAPLDVDADVTPMKRARSLAERELLLPTARLDTNRTVLVFGDMRSTQVEVSVDRCQATRLEDGRTVLFSEVELELKRGEPEDLLDAAQALQQAFPGLAPSRATKLQRALE